MEDKIEVSVKLVVGNDRGSMPLAGNRLGGFEPYREPTDDEIKAALREAPVILDSNVLLGLYSMTSHNRDTALKILDGIRDNLWMPDQVKVEFFNNRVQEIAKLGKVDAPINRIRNEINNLIASSRVLYGDDAPPDVAEEINRKRVEIEDLLDSLRGESLSPSVVLATQQNDPVLQWIFKTYADRFGQPYTDDQYAEILRRGHKRFENKIPPGFADAANKKNQKPEEGCGDYIMWEQVLAHVNSAHADGRNFESFVIVTNEVAKGDWRTARYPENISIIPPIHPRLLEESLSRTGARLILLTSAELYRLLDKDAPIVLTANANPSDDWTRPTYELLLVRLQQVGRADRARVIQTAARNGGFISRTDAYGAANRDENRLLVRFTMPVTAVQDGLVDSGRLSAEAQPALEAVYEGPGRAIGFRTPEVFTDFEKEIEFDATVPALIHRILRLMPMSKWTSYSDIGRVVGSSAQGVASHLTSCRECELGYHVLTSQGTISEGFRWSDATDERDPMLELEKDGVRFTDGIAASEDRLDAEALNQLLRLDDQQLA